MSTELIINASLPETRIALMENGEIQELLIERASGKGIVGNIYKGRVTRVLPGMQAAFVDIGLEKAAFLYVDDVFVHSEIWEDEEGPSSNNERQASGGEDAEARIVPVEGGAPQASTEAGETAAAGSQGEGPAASETGSSGPSPSEMAEAQEHADEYAEEHGDFDGDEEDDEDDEGPVGMGPGPDGGEGDSGDRSVPEGTIAPPSQSDSQPRQDAGPSEGGNAEGGQGGGEGGPGGERGEGRRRHRRGRRGGRNRRRGNGDTRQPQQQQARGTGESSTEDQAPGSMPDNYYQSVSESGESTEAERPTMAAAAGAESNRPEASAGPSDRKGGEGENTQGRRSEFREQRGRDRRIKAKPVTKSVRGQVNIQDLLQEGQEVLVQVAKDPIATKGARLTCHISLPGRHLVCMPTIDHVGVSRRIERDDERRRLREYVERNRPRNLGFIVRTASGKQQSEKRIKQDIDYLSHLWDEIREKAANVTAPALVYEDLNSVLRAIRDWVTEEIDKIIVDSRYHHNDILRFISHFMPSLRQKVELYHGDIPIFDAYNITTELSRALERKVWLKSGGYLVIDQAEALVAIDVNTGRYVGKKNLEDTILKTNLEAVQEIAYQLRLRNCGGIIILDLIDMEKEENKQRVYRALEEALKKDRARPTILKISELGLVEMTRKRTRDTIVRSLCESCTHCEGKGFIKSKQTVAYEALREIEREGIERDLGKILVQAHADVIDILAIEERDTMDQLERRYRKQIYLQAVGDFHPEQFEVIGEKRERGEAGREQLSNRREQSRDRQNQGDRNRGRDRDQNRDRQAQGGRDQNRDRQAQGGRDQNRDRGGDQGSGGQGGGRDQNRDRGRGGRGRDRDQNRRGDRPAGTGVVIRPVTAEVGAEGAMPAEGAEEFDPQQQGMTATEGGAPEFSGVPSYAGKSEEEMTEEDRLAFLRAQAAQDAALAGHGAAPGANRAGGGNPPRQDKAGWKNGDRDRSGRRRRRGGRGGSKFNPQAGGQPGAPGAPGFRDQAGDGQASDAAGSGSNDDTRSTDSRSGGGSSESTGGSSGNEGGSGGGSGDNSTPPV